MDPELIKIVVEFSGGMELIFDNRKRITIKMKAASCLADLIFHLRDNELKERPELFMQGQSV
jgi:ubiquitin related modifier 1